jgi:hypothetical protein
MHLEGFQVVLSHFWALVCTGLTGQSAGPVHMLGSGLTGAGDRSDWCELKLLQLPCFQVVCMHWFTGSLHVCRESSLWLFELWSGGLCSFLELCFISDVSSRCLCLRGLRLVFFK